MNINFLFILSQIVVATAYIILGIGFNKEKRLDMLHYSNYYQILMIIHYSLLSGISGIIACIQSIFRNFLFIYNENKNRPTPSWIVILLSVLAIILTIVFYETPADIFPCIITLMGIYTFWFRNTKINRIGNLCVSLCYIIYAISLNSWFSIICELYLSINTIIGYYKYEYKPVLGGNQLLDT